MSTLIPGIDITSSALQAERTRLEVVAGNIGNSQTTRGPDGKAYQRKEVVFETMMNGADPTQKTGGVKVAKIMNDPTPGQKIYMPGHPHADAKGYVTMPNVNVVEEMVDMMTASRSFEADLQVLKSARQMVSSSIRIAEAS